MLTRLTIAVWLSTAACAVAQAPSKYCAVEVHVRSSNGVPVNTGVMIEAAGEERKVALSVNGIARFCDVGLEVFSVVVGEPCGRVTISGLSASPPSTRIINVIYDVCYNEPPPGGNACTILLRVRTKKGPPLPGASLWVNQKLYRESDRYGRIYLLVRYDDSLQGTVKHRGYEDQDISIRCRPHKSRFNERVELTPTAR